MGFDYHNEYLDEGCIVLHSHVSDEHTERFFGSSDVTRFVDLLAEYLDVGARRHDARGALRLVQAGLESGRFLGHGSVVEWERAAGFEVDVTVR